MKTIILFYCLLTSLFGISQLNSAKICYVGNDSLQISIVGSTNVSCYGSCDAYANVTIDYGSGLYTYNWNGPNGYTTSQPSASGLCAGLYYVQVIDVLTGVICEDTFSIIEPDSLHVIAMATDVSCNSICDGSLIASVTGGTAPYIYSLDGITWTANNNFNALCYGFQNFYVKDANGCVKNYTGFIGSNGINLSLSSSTNETTLGANDGTLNFSSTGVGNVVYTLTSSSTGAISNSTGIFNGLSNDWYSICANDANGCFDCDSVYVGLDSTVCSFNVSFSVTPTSCPQLNTGSINLTFLGGTPPYNVSWSDQVSFLGVNYLTNITSNTLNINGLYDNPHNVYITDSAGCVYSQVINVSSTSTLGLQLLNINNATNYTISDGSITVSGSGGVTNYFYTSNGITNTTGVFTGLSEGIHGICVTDQIGCTFCDTFVVNVDSLPCNLASYLQIIQSPTNGQCNGHLTAFVTGSTTYNAYWIECTTNTIVSTTPQFFNACSGSYSLVTQDYVTGCTDTSSCITVLDSVVNCQLWAVDSVISNGCGSNCSGQITVYASGGSGHYNYALNGGTAQSGHTWNNLCAGAYQILVTDTVTGCTYLVLSQIVNSGSNLSATLNPIQDSDSTCNGIMDINITGGSGNYFVHFYNCSSGSIVANSVPAQGLCAGDYYAVVYDLNTGCSDTTSCVTINPVVTMPCNLVAYYTTINESCANTCDGSLIVSITGGTAPYTIDVVGGVSQYISNVTGIGVVTEVMNNICAGVYNIEVVDANGCSTLIPSVNVGSESLSMITSITGVSSLNASDGIIAINTSGNSNTYQYSIDGGVTWSFGNNQYTFNNLLSGGYAVCVSDSGCIICDSIFLDISTSIQAQSTKEVVIYPNPNNGQFSLDLPPNIDGAVKLILTDARGRQIWHQETITTNAEINATDFVTKGLYFLHVQYSGKNQVIKVVIQ